jgi:foldase protein PrsA
MTSPLHTEEKQARRWSRRVAPRLLAAVALAAAAVAVALLAGCGSDSHGATPGPSTAVVATVNGHPVDRGRVDAVMSEARFAGREISEEKALDSAIEEELLRQEADRLGVAVPAGSVDARVKALERQVGGAAALDEALRGAAFPRGQLRERLAVVALGERVGAVKFSDMSVSRSRSRAYYRRHLDLFAKPAEAKLGDIVCKTERLASGAIDRIREGQGFYATARQFSGDPELKKAGGQLGWVPVSSLPEPIGHAVAQMEPGEVSAMPVTYNGFHVLKLYARRAERTAPFAEVDRPIRSLLLARQRDAALRRWLNEARAGAQIEKT